VDINVVSESAVNSEGLAVAANSQQRCSGQPAGDDYHASVISTSISGRCAHETWINPQLAASQMIPVQPFCCANISMHGFVIP